MARSVLRPLVPRDPDEPHRVATPLELFTDLVFVVAISQAVSSVHHEASAGHLGHGLLGFAMVFFAIWWAWLNFAWFSSAYDNDDVVHRVLTLVQVLGSLVLAAGVPKIFDGDFRLGVIGYVVMRLALVLQWLRVAASHPEGRATAMRYASGILFVQVGWIARLWFPDSWGVASFAVLAVAEMSVPIIAERPGMTPWHPHHIAERYSLFFIIVLGETLLSATAAIQKALDGEYPAAQLAYVVIGGILVVFSAWWLYFARDSADLLNPSTSFAWGYGHYFIYASGALIGAGLAVRVDFWTHHSSGLTETASALLVTGPVAAFLASLWVVTVRMHDDSVRTWGPFVIAIVGVLAATFLSAAVLLAGLICVALLVTELRLTSTGSVVSAAN